MADVVFLEADRAYQPNGTGVTCAPTSRTWDRDGAAIVFLAHGPASDVTGSSANGFTWTHQVVNGVPGAHHIWTTPVTAGLRQVDFQGTWTGNKRADVYMFMFYGADVTKFHTGSTVVVTGAIGSATITGTVPSEGLAGTNGVAITYWYHSSLDYFNHGASGPSGVLFPTGDTAPLPFVGEDSVGIGTYLGINPGYKINSFLGSKTAVLYCDPLATVAVTFRGIRIWLGDIVTPSSAGQWTMMN